MLARMAMVMEGVIRKNKTPTDQEEITMDRETALQGKFYYI